MVLDWLKVAGSGGREFALFRNSRKAGAFLEHGSHFDFDAVRKCRALARNGDGFVEIIDGEEKIAADDFLGFSEGTVRHVAAIGSGEDLSLILQGVSAQAFAFLLQSLEPGIPVGDNLLQLLRGEAFVPVGTAKQEQIIVFGGCCAHISVG